MENRCSVHRRALCGHRRAQEAAGVGATGVHVPDQTVNAGTAQCAGAERPALEGAGNGVPAQAPAVNPEPGELCPGN